MTSQLVGGEIIAVTKHIIKMISIVLKAGELIFKNILFIKREYRFLML
jgi:hypothetical protein